MSHKRDNIKHITSLFCIIHGALIEQMHAHFLLVCELLLTSWLFVGSSSITGSQTGSSWISWQPPSSNCFHAVLLHKQTYGSTYRTISRTPTWLLSYYTISGAQVSFYTPRLTAVKRIALMAQCGSWRPKLSALKPGYIVDIFNLL